ncbi:efflux RND transporter periplasmic adaptor subunit [candidate division KSB1 bacterium]|nr:efflux RND transporter periplasmic adaptor subunit [candidate division KSB1 bacterium]
MLKKYILISILAFFIVGCSQQQKTAEKLPIEKEKVAIKVATVIDTTIVETLAVTGELKPSAQIEIYVKTAGLIISKTVKVGQRVKKDEILAEMVQDIPGMQFSPLKIKATTDGIITMDAIEVGSNVTPQRPVFAISQLNPIEMVAKVVESYISQLKTGKQVAVTLSAFPTEIFNGHVTEVSPILEPLSRSVTIKIQLMNPMGRLRPGMFGQARFEIGAHPGMMIPLDAVVQTGVMRFVFKINQGKAQQQTIATGLIAGDKIEVMGLQSGDQVVVLGQNLLEDGVDVRIVED